jgi:hypothetical protein
MDFLKSLLGSIATEFVSDQSERGMAALANRTRPGDPPPRSVRYGWTAKILSLMVCAIFVPLTMIVALSVVLGQLADGGWIIAPLFGAIAIWLCIGCFDTFVRRVDLDKPALRFRKWNGVRTASWDDIVSLEEKSHPPHLRIVFRDGEGFGIFETMNGSRYFLSLVRSRITPSPNGSNGGKRRRRRRRGRKTRAPTWQPPDSQNPP